MRSDGDTWDIVSSVGRTALGVATFRALETDRSDRIIRDDYARMFVDAAAEPHFIAILDDPSRIGDRNFFPRMVGPRTRFFDDFCLAATAAGVRQAVILAAGLDARSFRLDWPAGTTVYEIDQRAVLEFKDRVLAEHAARAKADRRTVAVDLRADWPSALLAAGFDAAAPTAWLAEGLLPYLPGVAQDALFERIDTLSRPDSRLAAHGGPGGADFRRFRELAKQYFDTSPFGDQAPFDLWYDDERADPMQWLAGRGWTVHGHRVADLFADYGRPLPDMSGVPAELADMRYRISFWSAEKASGDMGCR
jgi:methyltransferase (TIGR00027 family)